MSDRSKARARDIAPVILIAAAFAAALAWRAGSITPTFDEMVDSVIAGCHVNSLNPFFCTADISQGRLPYIVHALARLLFSFIDRRAADLLVSGIAGVAAVVALSFVALRALGRRAAVLTALVLAANASMLAAGRMAMTHSNVLFALFTVLALGAFLRFLDDRRTGTLLAAAALFGASVASNIIGASTALLFLFLFAASSDDRDRLTDMLSFAAASLVAFFALSPTHLVPENLRGVFTSIAGIRGVSTNHDYLGTGLSVAPRWYPFLLYAVKLSPWWLPWLGAAAWFGARERDMRRKTFLAAVGAFIVLFLGLKSLFRYDAPHHHVHVIALGCLLVGYGAASAFAAAKRPLARAVVGAAFAACLALQLVAVAQVFPNMLFYGAQFSPRLIGEFYGPAVVQCQDQGEIRAVLRRLVDEGRDVRTMATVCWGATRTGDLAAPWWNSLPHRPEEGGETYVFGEWVLFHHFKLTEEQRVQRDRILASCEEYAASDFPFLEDVYVVYRCPADPAFDELVRLEVLDESTLPANLTGP